MPDPNLRLLEEVATKLDPFLREIVFVGGVTLGLLITDKAAAPIRSTDDVDVPSGRAIRVITAPYFLGTKMEAFRGRGQMDFLASHDLEDFVAVIDGRSTILKEIADSASDIREYLAEAARSLLRESRFFDAVPGFVLEDGRVPLILQRLNQLVQLNA